MKIVYLSPGTGSFYCGTCMRDNALVLELRELGHAARLVPMYLPLQLDEESAAAGEAIEFGGVNVYLQQMSALFRHAPRWVDRFFNGDFFMNFAAKRAGMTDAAGLGEMTLSMLRGESGRQAKELEKLCADLAADPPDVIVLSHALLLGLVRELKRRLGCAVVCSLQGEDGFLDGLDEPFDEKCWTEAAARARDVDAFIAVSRTHGELMAGKLALPDERWRVIYNGIHLDGYETIERIEPESGGRVIGYLSRMHAMKGLPTLIDAFIDLKDREGHDDVTLRVVGSVTAADEPLVNDMWSRLESAGLGGEATFNPNVTREEKIGLLKGMDLLSVPATYGESFGLYLLEAWAAGVPVVQPRSGAFPELIDHVGGGTLVEPDDAKALADGWAAMLADPGAARAMGEKGRAAVAGEFTARHMAEQVAGVLEQVEKKN